MKISEQILTVAYLHLILFRIHEKDTSTEIKFDIVIQMTLVYVLAKRLKQGVKQTARVSNINDYVCINAKNPGK